MSRRNFLKHRAYRDNNVDAFIPELWAKESIAILLENMVAGNLVYRDYSNDLANFGDVVNVPKPAELVALRKTNADNVTIQDATATTVRVPLDQHVHCSVLIRDGEESKSFKDLITEFLKPQVISMARYIDQMVLGQYPQFLANSAGVLNGLTVNNAVGYVLELRSKLNINKAPMNGRNLILNPVTETTLLNIPEFTKANEVGDSGQALANAALGRKLGFDLYMDQNMPSVATGNTVIATAGQIANSGGYAIGDSVLTVDTYAVAVTPGSWVTIAGDVTPHRVTAVTDTLGATTEITISPPLRSAVLNDAVIVTYSPGAVDNGPGYAAGYAKEITVDGFTVAPKIGQIVSFGTASPVYTVMRVNGLVGITLDRPLDAAITNNTAVGIGPAGNYNLAFHKNAIALVNRPLARPMQNAGARSAVESFNNVAMRVVITYNGEKQGHLVTVDMLTGIAILDTNLGGVLLG